MHCKPINDSETFISKTPSLSLIVPTFRPASFDRTTTVYQAMTEENHSMGPSLVQAQYPDPHIEGALNMRDFGGYPSNVRQGAMTRRGFIYRSGHHSHITSQGWDKMRDQLHISTIFRLTDSNEASTLYGDTQSEKIKDFHVVHLPFHQEGFDKTSVFTKYSRHVSEGHSVWQYVLIYTPSVSNVFHRSLPKDT